MRDGISFVLSAILLMIGGFSSETPGQGCVPAPVGLVSWSSADGNALDSRSRNDGTLQNGATFTGGHVGQGFDLDGVNDFVSAPDSPSLRSADLTIEGWFRLDRLDNTQVLISKAVGGTINHSFVAYYTNTSSPIGFATGNAGGLNPPIGAPAVLSAGQWNHFAFTYNDASDSQLIYVNGVVAAGSTATLPIGYDANVVNLGAANNTGSYANFLDGGVDELSIYNRTLSGSEIAAIHAAGTAGKCKPTATASPSGQVGWWAADGNANDAAGANNGTLNGGAGFSIGRAGQTFKFDGVNDYVEVPDSPNLRITGTVTLEFWAKRNRLGLDLVLEKGGDWTLGQTNYGVGLHSVNNNMFYFFYAGGGKGVDGVSDLNWHHYAVVATSGQTNVDFYIDGVLRPVQHNFGAAAVNLNPSALPLHIGAQIDGTFNTYGRNDIDELSIYDRGLSGTEIASIFNAGLAGKLKQSATIDTNSLVSLWKGENNANDTLGANNGTFAANTYGSGRIGQAFSLFNLPGVLVPDSPTLNPQVLTIEAWVTAGAYNCPGGPNTCQAFIIDKAGTTGSFGYSIGVREAGALRFLLNGGSGGADVFSSRTVNDANFHHIVGTYDGAVMRIFIDGVLDSQTAVVTGVNYQAGSQLHIGSRAVATGSTVRHPGLIDEAAIYNRALSADEVRRNFEAGNAFLTRVGDATITLPTTVTAAGMTQQIPLNRALLPPVPFGGTAVLAYDIATSAVFTGSPTVCFNLPSFNTPASFSELRVLHLESGVWQNRTTTSDFATRTLCAQVTSLSPFAIATLAPTAANASIAGRVTWGKDQGAPRVRVTVSGGDLPRPITATTNAFGYYRFDDLPAGRTYIVEVASKNLIFPDPARIVDLSSDAADIDFHADSP